MGKSNVSERQVEWGDNDLTVLVLGAALADFSRPVASNQYYPDRPPHPLLPGSSTDVV